MYLFHLLSWNTDTNNRFHDVTIYWDAPACYKLMSGDKQALISDQPKKSPMFLDVQDVGVCAMWI